MRLSHDYLTEETAAPVIAALHQACFDPGWTEAEFKSLLSVPGGLVQITSLDHNPVGFCFYRLVAEEAEIITIGVLPEYRNRTVGAQLLENGQERLAGLNINTLFLEVSETNLSAQKLYENIGFSVTGRRKNYYTEAAEKVDALIMSKLLNSNNFH
ncbi:ribosomal protein S18-alanine N-acetyltransferase [Sneathiella sp.]|jgi:ribosomal-protein-alanine N-acetyltransferase|uniref:ribosomal protein S18-alanine N-acetyltransferase n=1 Tax=Sneathiella sp. TaxID=1964365 RepID=UPI0039E42FA7